MEGTTPIAPIAADGPLGKIEKVEKRPVLNQTVAVPIGGGLKARVRVLDKHRKNIIQALTAGAPTLAVEYTVRAAVKGFEGGELLDGDNKPVAVNINNEARMGAMLCEDAFNVLLDSEIDAIYLAAIGQELDEGKGGS